MSELHWIKIAESEAELFRESPLRRVTIRGKDLCVGRYQQQVFACVNKCPHAGGHLSQGWVDADGKIVCPLHRYKFNIKSGYNSSGEGYFIKTYPVKSTDDGVFVSL